MSYEIAKILLEHAQTFLDRTEAIQAALQLGMPINEIQAYLDWIDLMRSQGGRSKQNGKAERHEPNKDE